MTNLRGMALWLKILLSFAALGFLGLVGLIIGAAILFHSITDTDKVKAVAASFMTIDDPLPTGFQYVHGYVLSGIPFIQIRGDGVNTLYTFSTMPSGEFATADASPEKLIDTAAKGDVPGFLGADSTRKILVSQHSTITAGGQTMPYVMGHVDAPLGADKETVNTFIGAVHSPKKGRLIVLWAERNDPMHDSFKPLSVDDVKRLTESIKSF